MLDHGGGIAILIVAFALAAIAAVVGIHTGGRQATAAIFDDFRELSLVAVSPAILNPYAPDEDSPSLFLGMDEERNGPAEPTRRTLQSRSGDTLAKILHRAGVAEDDSKRALHALRSVYNARQLRSGQRFTLVFGGDDPKQQKALESLVFDADPEREVKLTRYASGFTATVAQRPVERVLVKASGRIDQSFYQAGEKARVPGTILHEMMRAYAWDVDFQREIQQGDIRHRLRTVSQRPG